MRPQQQNRRMRGRNNNNNNNNRKGPNPLTRNYESNGPDVKIRGSAQQIAEKYATLARDAQSAGDRVMAENYLQHAEHYNRIIAAAQAQMPIQNFRDNRDEFDDDLDEEREEQQQDGGNQQPGEQAVANGNSPQPVIEGTPAEVALNPEAGGDGEQPRGERPNGFHNNYNGDDNYRRNRRSRRGGRGGRPDFEQGGEGEPTQSAEGGEAEAAPQQPGRREAAAETPAADTSSAEAPASEPATAEPTPVTQD
jgi:hypothetical protein